MNLKLNEIFIKRSIFIHRAKKLTKWPVNASDWLRLDYSKRRVDSHSNAITLFIRVQFKFYLRTKSAI